MEAEGSSLNDSQNLVYLFTRDLPESGLATFKWSSVNPHGDISVTENNNTRELSIPTTNASSYPHELLKLEHSSITTWKSRIYFVGGRLRRDISVHSDKVFVFDTETSSWIGSSDPHPPPSPMMHARLHPVIIAYDNKIYVFGSAGFHLHPLTHSLTHDQKILHLRDRWAECYDLDNGGWDYLPPPPKSILVSTELIHSYVVYETEKMFLFWVYSVGVFCYNFHNRTWSRYVVTDPISSLPQSIWCDRLEMLGDILFWHSEGNIYSYDFVLENNTLLYNLNDHMHVPPASPYTPTFLVRVSQDMLCLVWVERDLDDRDRTLSERVDQIRARPAYCHKFQICIESATSKVALVHHGFTSFTTPGYTVENVVYV